MLNCGCPRCLVVTWLPLPSRLPFPSRALSFLPPRISPHAKKKRVLSHRMPFPCCRLALGGNSFFRHTNRHAEMPPAASRPPHPQPAHTPRPHSLPAGKMRAPRSPTAPARLHLASPPTLRARSLIIHISGGRMYPNLFIVVICARLSLRGKELQIKQFNPCLHCRPLPSEGRQ